MPGTVLTVRMMTSFNPQNSEIGTVITGILPIGTSRPGQVKSNLPLVPNPRCSFCLKSAGGQGAWMKQSTGQSPGAQTE